ncbi:MAG: hypothetical protein SGILL_000886 [Bacillariaceae sp.]
MDVSDYSFLPPLLVEKMTVASTDQSLPTLSFTVEEDSSLRSATNHSFAFQFTGQEASDIDSPPWSFFYNIYMPSDPGNASMVRDILDEQLHQVAISYAANVTNRTSLRIFYNTIGSPVDATFMDATCRKRNSRLQCIHMEHHDEAFEERTLARVQEYCQYHPTHRVGYMHNKGSYNSRNSRNQYWRRHMTMAISDKRCMEPPVDACDMCGLNFYVLPWMHFSGNFFTAKCEYINRLLPIDEFTHKMSQLSVQTTEYEHQGRFLFHIFHNKDTYMGLNRYASEAWLGSHPSLVACDVSVARKVDFWKRLQHDVYSNWNFSVAPRPTDQSGKFLHIRRTLRNRPTYRMREYYLLAGHMFKWTHLYGQVPTKSSWVWKHFPDGEEWREGYHKFGENVVEALLDGFALQDGNLSLPIYANVTKHDQDLRKWEEKKKRQRNRRKSRRERERMEKQQTSMPQLVPSVLRA